jgi:hypothetical protein
VRGTKSDFSKFKKKKKKKKTFKKRLGTMSSAASQRNNEQNVAPNATLRSLPPHAHAEAISAPTPGDAASSDAHSSQHTKGPTTHTTNHNDPLRAAQTRLTEAIIAAGQAQRKLAVARSEFERAFDDDIGNQSTSKASTVPASRGAWAQRSTVRADSERERVTKHLEHCELMLERTQQEYIAAKKARDAIAGVAPLNNNAKPTPPPPPLVQAMPTPQPAPNTSSVLALLTRTDTTPFDLFLQQSCVLDLDEVAAEKLPVTLETAPILLFARWLSQRLRCNFATIANAMRDTLSPVIDVGHGRADSRAWLYAVQARCEKASTRLPANSQSNIEYVKAVTQRLLAASDDNNADPLATFADQCRPLASVGPASLNRLWRPFVHNVLLATMEEHEIDSCKMLLATPMTDAAAIVRAAVTSLNGMVRKMPSNEWANTHVFTCTIEKGQPVVHIMAPFGFRALQRVRLFTVDVTSTERIASTMCNMIAVRQIINYAREQGSFAPLRLFCDTCGDVSCTSSSSSSSSEGQGKVTSGLGAQMDSSMSRIVDPDTGLMHVLTTSNGTRAHVARTIDLNW